MRKLISNHKESNNNKLTQMWKSRLILIIQLSVTIFIANKFKIMVFGFTVLVKLKDLNIPIMKNNLLRVALIIVMQLIMDIIIN